MKLTPLGSGIGPQNTIGGSDMANNNDQRPNLPHPDAVTNNQIDGLLRVINTMTGCLSVSRPTGLEQCEPTVVGEDKAAVQTTLWAACAQLQNIIKDPGRWNMTFQKTLEDRAESLFKRQEDFLNAQIAAAQEVSKPHFKYRPTMKRMDGGNWICFVGDLTKPQEGECIIGIGKTPAEAVNAFDENFYGTITPYMQQWLAQREAEVNQEPNEQNKLDPGTDSETGSPS